MATGLKSSAAPLDDSDPFRLGWRYVNEKGADGVVVSRQVPLTEADVLHPQEDDFIVQNEAHDDDITYLKLAFRISLTRQPARHVFCDHRIDFGVKGIEPFGPDLVIFEGVLEWDKDRGTFYAAETGARPLLVVEVTSPSTRRNDVGVKVEFYQQCAVPLYVLIDRQVSNDDVELALWAYQLGPDGYQLIEVDDLGRIWLEPVGLWLSIAEGKAVCTDASGRRILSPIEEVEARRQAEERAELAEAKLRALEEELRRRNGS